MHRVSLNTYSLLCEYTYKRVFLQLQDLAAQNVIIVDQDEICKVGDFGLLQELPKEVEIYRWLNQSSIPYSMHGWCQKVS